MKKKLTAVLMALLLTLSCAAAMSPAFGASNTWASAKAQAHAYNRHSIGLTGVSNARELGGYKTKDGRTVKFGKLLRTAELVDMSASDKQKLEQKYRVVKDIDFRSNRNILTDGEDPELKGAEYSHYPYSSTLNLVLTSEGIDIAGDLLEEALRGEFDMDLLDTYFREGYKQMYLDADGIAMFRGFFKELLDADGGTVLWHCVSGKDRTGNATILLLHVLGVDRKTIIQDFLLSNEYLSDEIEESYDRAYQLTGNKRIAKDFSLRHGVQEDWIRMSFRTMEQYYGSVDNFLQKKVGLTKSDYKKLQNAYLQ